MSLHPEIEALLVVMRELEELLSVHSAFWSANVRRAADEVANSDGHGLQRFLSFFGGMGSLNDLVLHQGGKPLRSENDRLDALRSKAWSVANALRHEIE